MMKEKSIPCPFCGYTKLYIISDEYKTICWYVSCPACLCNGPVSDKSEAEAMELWNARMEWG